jgi:integrase/recombinase XerD
VTQETINNYLSSKVDKWSGGSFNCFFKAIRQYFTFTKITFELPAFKKVEQKIRPYLSEEIVQNILDQCPVIFQNYKKVQCVIHLLCYSGMRPKELLTLKRENINIEKRQIVLKNTKTFKSRIVFITPDVAKDIVLIFEREAEQDNAFNLTDTSISYYCQQISKYLNIQFTPYMCRHSFSHLFLKKSHNDLIGLSKLLGHTNLKTTQIYTNINDEELQKGFDNAFKKRRSTKKK